MKLFRIGMAQINPVVGDLEGNTEKIKEYMDRGRELGVHLITFPELSVPGYPPEDLLLKPDFVKANIGCLEDIVKNSRGITAVVGFVDMEEDIFNAAAIIQDGELADVYHKVFLPNYAVFDEYRYFQKGKHFPVYTLNGVTFGINICEDIWYPGDPTRHQCLKGGAQLIVNISASPFYAGKRHARQRMLSTRAVDYRVIVAFNNIVGGQDELVFDGNSMIMDQNGDLIAKGRQFEEDFIVADLDMESVNRMRLKDLRWRREKEFLEHGISAKAVTLKKLTEKESAPALPPREVDDGPLLDEILGALVLGTRDYVRKNGFEKVLLGMSGGIDSALTAAIAVRALGKDNVIAVSMPSDFSSQGSKADSRIVAERLGIKLLTIPIQEIFDSYLNTLSSCFEGRPSDVTEENIQARVRGNILMAISNKFNYLVLTTGNKSETSVGYCTLYGDMAGGFAVIKDLPKTMVNQLARWINDIEGRELIPESVLTKAPSAELRPDQKDEDSLPPYDLLDKVLHEYVEQDKGAGEIVDMGFDEKLVVDVISMVDGNEYKRRQAPPGIRITPKAFGKDRRLPITNRFRSYKLIE
jgi:NAD+ synthase (glutamine-hydrolysing)